VGNGEDELLDLVMKVFAKKNSQIVLIEPSFTMYAYYAQVNGGKKVSVLLKPNFDLDVDRILEENAEKNSLLVLCSPNNPTGNQFKLCDIEKILQEFNGVVVVDEAYVDFAKYSIIDWVRNFDKLIVLRTFSKTFGLAGIRFGFLVSNRSIVEYVKRVTSPFNVNIVTQRLITSVLRHSEYFKEQTQSIIEERKWLKNKLAKIEGINPYHSDANFILFKVTRNNLSSSVVTKKLENRNILVKDRGSLPLLINCIRVTVGTRKMNEAFLSALQEVLEN
jgi:histidinol-phosphate aminotransferase